MTALRGIDVSSWQGVINWGQIKRDGISFAFIKATEGANIVDPDFAANWAGAKAVGLIRGAYSFTRPEAGNPEAQAVHFLSTIGGLDAGDLAALDFETPEIGGDESAFALASAIAVNIKLGFPPLLYCSQDWARNRLTDPHLSAFPLWLACLDPQVLPASIGVWKTVALHQHSWTLSVPGIAGNTDGDELERSLDGLRALGKPAPPVLVWHALHTCALKPEPVASHFTGSIHTVLGGDVVVPTGKSQMALNPMNHVNEEWWEVTTTIHGMTFTGFLLKANLYHD
ncbi:MAG: glycoside hydrolase family 25 [Chloroflexi bacterium]|nr:glycoside hydrolase family 25 [Chloroflexota bacterium]